MIKWEMTAEHPDPPLGKPIRDLGLTIAGTSLAPLIDVVLAEMAAVGLRRLRPRFYLSTEWGVPEDTIAVAIPFYLARPDLASLHLARTGHTEGQGDADVLRYLRHEIGHVVNYAYCLHAEPRWTELFGRFEKRYREAYRPRPFSRRFVRHLPGWYAQKHPDEDFAETFAVWMTPGSDWRHDYADSPPALAKLLFCDEMVARVGDLEPTISDDALHDDVGDIATTLEQFYGVGDPEEEALPGGVDGALRDIFPASPDEPRAFAATLLRRLDGELTTQVYTWTGHFPDRTHELLRRLARRAEAMGLHYAPEREAAAVVAVSTLITALAMNHVLRGSYVP
jgi:hypothetical protein